MKSLSKPALGVLVAVILWQVSGSQPLQAAITVTVNTTDDLNDGTCNQTHCSLREAIAATNASSGLDTIGFNLPGTAPFIIAPATVLPNITSPVLIDGRTQPGYQGVPLVQLNGTKLGSSGIGLRISAGNSTVRGLVINGFGKGILITTNGGNRIAGNYLGMAADGMTALKNNWSIHIQRTSGDVIGGTSAQDRNLIVGGSYGIFLESSSSTTIQGNYLGVAADGATRIVGPVGINAANSKNIRIGGTTAGARNVIGGHTTAAVRFLAATAGSSTGHAIQGNYIGTDVTGTKAVNNTIGIWLEGSQSLIGGSTPGARNLISGNVQGISIRASGTTSFENVVEGNYIGTNVTGSAALQNTDGIWVMGFANSPLANSRIIRNVISGNVDYAISLSNANGYTIAGNYIGTDATGTHSVPNRDLGIRFISSSYNMVGGTNAGDGNIIANGYEGGIKFSDSATVVSRGNSFLQNSMYNNGSIHAGNARPELHNTSIKLVASSPLLNDPGDMDSGPNDYQNYPQLTGVEIAGGQVRITGYLDSIANLSYRLEFFANRKCGKNGYGQGERYLGTTTVTTDGSGKASFSLTFPLADSTMRFITATATEPGGSTSEFSACFSPETGTLYPLVIEHHETVTGSMVNSMTVRTSAPVQAVPGSFYLAAVASRADQAISSVTGLGLSWIGVGGHCSGRDQTHIRVMQGVGTPTGDSHVSAAFAFGAVGDAIIAVSRYTGVDLASPIGYTASGNTNGNNGSCSDGIDSATYASGSIPLELPGVMFYSALSMRLQTHTPGSGFTELADLTSSSNATTAAGLAVQQRHMSDVPQRMPASGSLSGSADWAVVAAELRVGTSKTPPDSTPTPMPTSTQTSTSTPSPTAAPTTATTPAPTVTPAPTTTFVPGAGITHSGTVTGESVATTAVSTRDPVAAVPDEVYLAAVATKPARAASGVSGMGLTWQRVTGQCAGRSQTYIDIWLGTGNPGSSVVTAAFSSAPQAAVISVSRFAGVDPADPVGSILSANTRGTSGACSGGTDSSSYQFDLVPGAPNGLVFSAASMRANSHTAGAGFSEIADLVAGSSGTAAGLAVQVADAGSASPVTVSGRFSTVVDWAAAAVELRPAALSATPAATSTATSTPTPTDFPSATSTDAPTNTVESATPTVTSTSASTDEPTPTELPTTVPPDVSNTPEPTSPARIVHQETAAGSALASTTVGIQANVAVDSSSVYLAALSTRPYRPALRVSGMGLTWTRVVLQCAGRRQTGVELWIGSGTPGGDGQVSGQFTTAPDAVVLAVSRYTGVDLTNPIAGSVGMNTIGVGDTTCTGGVDSASYSAALPASVPGAMIYGAVGQRHQSHRPGAGYEELAESRIGSSGNIAGLAVQQHLSDGSAPSAFNGSFNGVVDWAAAALVLRPASPATTTPSPLLLVAVLGGLLFTLRFIVGALNSD